MDLMAMAASLAGLDPDVDDADLVDRIRALEMVKASAAAAQARAAAALDASQRAAQTAAGVPAAELGRGVAAQVALARRDSPHRGGQHLGLATALVHEMPCALAALQAGRISEWRATILVRETAVLTLDHRRAVDEEVASDPDRLEQLGDRALAARVKQVAYRLDPRSVVERARRAEGERRVTIRPAPDTMAYLTALLPARDAIAAHTALARAADAARHQGAGAEGERRGRGQLMADLLVASATATAAADGGPEDVAIRLVMTDRALLDGDHEPAHLDGYGPVPAAWARDLVTTTLDATTRDATTRDAGGEVCASTAARVFVKRLLTDRDGALVAMDSRARVAPTGLAALIRTRDAGTCRTPWCDAPARHVDHVVPHARGGPTSANNSQGLCEACNQTKEALGWRSRVLVRSLSRKTPPGSAEGDGAEGDGADRDGADRDEADRDEADRDEADRDEAPPVRATRHGVEITTPTGHTYTSVAPPLPGAASHPGAARLSASAAKSPEVAAAPDECSIASPVEAWVAEWLTLVA